LQFLILPLAALIFLNILGANADEATNPDGLQVAALDEIVDVLAGDAPRLGKLRDRKAGLDNHLLILLRHARHQRQGELTIILRNCARNRRRWLPVWATSWRQRLPWLWGLGTHRAKRLFVRLGVQVWAAGRKIGQVR
jgi:hypothetical protein